MKLMDSPEKAMEEEMGMTAQSTPASVRREQWRDTQQQSIGSIEEYHLDPVDRDIRNVNNEKRFEHFQQVSQNSIEESHLENSDDFLSPYQNRSPQSSFSSPQISVESQRISFSPLQIKDSIEEEEVKSVPVPIRSQSLSVPDYLTNQPPTLSFRGCDYPILNFSNLNWIRLCVRALQAAHSKHNNIRDSSKHNTIVISKHNKR